jgi:TP901 family phage tail tape measure protein
MPIQVPVVQTGLEQSIQQAAAKAGKNLRINMGPGAKSIESLSKPLGRLTGKADEFTKSMEAANARVLAFGASVGVIAAVSRGLQELVKTTIGVEKSLANINSILKQSESQLDSFKNQIFDIARNTGQTFDTVAEAALELSRQGLKAEEVTKRLNDALVLSRLSGLSAADSVAGLTAAVNSFSSAGLTTTEVLNKISAAAASAAVSDRDLIEGLKRSGAVAVASGVQFDELIGIISALQERTARGGAVIGNSLKTIFTRIQDIEKLKALQNLGVQVTDLEGKVLSSNKVIENLAPTFAKLDQAAKVNLADNLVGKFQIAPFLALLEDYNLKVSRSGEVAATSFNATNEAYQRNEALSKTLADAVNVATVNLKELANTLGEIGVTDSLKNIIGVFNSVVSSIQDVLDGDGIGSQFAKGLIKGISTIISGPGLALALVAIGKLLLDFAKFGAGALRTFFGLNKAAEAQKNLQGQIAASLLNDKGIRSAILSIEKQNISEGEKKKLQTQFFTKALNEQLMVMQKMQGIARTIAPSVMAGTASRRGKRAAGGFLPIGAESSDISRGVGGAPASAKPVVIPNFAFGGGKRGTMVANDSEYIVPNYANGGDAIFNQNMASSMGLPANARKVRAASGYIPNFVNEDERLVLFAGDRGADFKKVFHVGKTKTNETKAYTSKASAPKGMRTKPVTVPAYRMKGGKGDAVPQDIEYIKKRLSESSSGTALKFAKDLSGKTKLPDLSKKRIQSLFNPGAFEGMSGSIFEVAISSILKSREFLDYASRHTNARIDLPYSERLFSKFGAVGKGKLGAEVKANSGLAASAAIKFYDVLVGGEQVATYDKNRFLGKTLKKSEFQKIYKNGIDGKGYNAVKRILGGTVTRGGAQNLFARSASGYIPNFAEGALEDAIGRERAAGLPVSQIRINQSGKLRNAQNPMGLAVTNTRDEPTGAIPNFNQQIGYVAASNAQSGFAQFDRDTIAAQKDTAAAAEKSAKAIEKNTQSFSRNSETQGGLTNKLIGAQIGMSLFNTGLGEATKETEGFKGNLAALGQGAISATQVLFAMQAFGMSPGFKLGGSRRSMATTALGVRGAMTFGAKGGMLNKATKGLGGMIGKLVGGFGRFVPILGTAITAFTLLNPLVKKLTGGIGIFEGIGRALGLVKSPAEKAAKALDGLADKAAVGLLQGQGNANFLSEMQSAMAAAARSGTSLEEELKKTPEQRASDFLNKVADNFTGEKFDTEMREVATYSSTGDRVEKVELKEVELNSVMGKGLRKNETKEQFREFEKIIQKGINITVLSQLDSKTQKDLFKKTPQEVQFLITDLIEKNLKIADAKKRKDFPNIKDRDLPSQRYAELETDSALLAMRGDTTTALDDIQEFLRSEMSQSDEDIKRKLKSGKLTEGEVAKAQLKNTIGLVKQETLRTNQLDLQIDRAKTLGSLTKLELMSLTDAKERKSLSNEFDNKRLSILDQEIDKLKQLNVDTATLEGIKQSILGVARNGLLTDNAALGFASRLHKLAGETGKLGETDKELLKEKLKALSKSQNLQKEELNAKQLQRIEDEIALQNLEKKNRLLSAGAALQSMSDRNQVTSAELKLQRDVNAYGLMANTAINPAAVNQQKNIVQAQGKRDIELGPAATALRQKQAFKEGSDFIINDIIGTSSIPKTEIQKLKAQASGIETEVDFKDFIDAAKLNFNPLLFGGDPETMEAIEAAKREILKKYNNEEKALAETLDNEVKIAGATRETLFSIELRLKRLRDPEIRNDARMTAQASALSEAQDLEAAGFNNRARQRRRDVDFMEARKDLPPELAIQLGMMNRGVSDRFKDIIPTALESSDKLRQTLAEGSLDFAHNIGNAMLDAIQKGENLGDVLLGTAAEFLNLISRAFMKSAVNDLLGSFGVGKQGGGPIRGGSGTKDDVPAMLMGGEFVMNKKAVRKYGMGFMSALNNGSLQGFASGGQVKDREGMFTTPGMNGAGAIKGAENLLSFATQTPVALNRDTITSSGAFLDAESGRMTMFGRRNNPQFQKVQDAKRQAFDLYASEMNARQQAKEQEKANKKALMDSLKGAAISAVVGVGMKSMAAGFKAGFSGTEGSFGAKLGAGLKGTIFGGNDIAGQSYGGLSNLFTGRGFQSGPSGLGSGFTPKSASARPSGNSAPLLDLYQGARLGGKMTMLPKRAATGGLIPAAGGVDTVPAMLSGGEFVMNAAATRNIGAGNLQALNSGAGVDNTDLVSKLDELILATEASQSTGEINITVNGSNGTDTQTSGQDTTDQQRQLSERIKVAVKQVIADEQRLGGQLRR